MNRVKAAVLALLPVLWLSPAPGSEETPLFLETHALDMELSFDRSRLCRERDRSACRPLSATLTLSEKGNVHRPMAVVLEPRGSWRLHRMRCRYPPLFVKFDAADAKGTLFEGQSRLPLTTHCFSNRPGFDAYVLKEYLAYRIFTRLTDVSIRARLVRVTYRDADGRAERRSHPAFFTEHFLSVAARHEGDLLTRGQVLFRHLDGVEMTRLALFQYLIGNTDWSVTGQHNTVLIRRRNGVLTPLPFDFDFSGLVNAEYAGPPPQLRIKRVTQRVFRGFCHEEVDWDALYREFLAARESVRETADEIAGESPRAARQATDFLDGFFRTLQSEKQRDRKIRRACRPLPKGQLLTGSDASRAGMR